MGFEADQSGLKGRARINEKHPVVFRKALQYASMASGKLEIRESRVEEINRKSDALYQLIKHLLNSGARDQAERGEWAFEFGRDAFARPDFVGWSVCGWVDTWRTMADKSFKQHSGFFSPQGELHEPYVRRQREVSEHLYEFARG